MARRTTPLVAGGRALRLLATHLQIRVEGR